MAVEIPLFPLEIVLYPHMPLALHIFEPRYREMLRDCEDNGTSFGIVGVPDDAGSAMARPYRVGTLAQLQQVDRLDDGRYDIVVQGASRFRINSVSVEKSYLVGEIDYLQDIASEPDTTSPLVGAVTRCFKTYIGSVGHIENDPNEETSLDAELPTDPELLSYLVSAALQVETSQKQELLELDSVAARLRLCLRLLRREMLFLDQMLVRRDPRQLATSSLN